jgi:hypothetical protein
MRSCLVAVVFCGFVVASQHAWANYQSGANCKSQSGLELDKLIYTRAWGVHNVSASSAFVSCPVVADYTSPAVVTFSAEVYDRSTTDNVGCTIKVIDSSGVTIRNAYVQSLGGGASTGPQFLSVDIDVTGAFAMATECMIPGVQNGWFSHITSYGFGGASPPTGDDSRLGSSCVPTDNAQRTRLSYDSNLGVYNNSTTTPARVICDLTGGSFLRVGILPFSVNVYDRHPTANFSCTFRYSFFDGTPAPGEFTKTTSSSGSFVQAMSVAETTDEAQLFTVECTIPPLSSTGLASSIFFTTN